MYPEMMLIPMREELSRAGLKEARTATDVDQALAESGTTMVVVNSICGCAAGKMRPGVRLAMQHTAKPDHAVTVFAGQDREATERARSYFGGHPPTLAGHRHPARRAACLPHAALCDREFHRPGNRTGTRPSLRHLLREGDRLRRFPQAQQPTQQDGCHRQDDNRFLCCRRPRSPE